MAVSNKESVINAVERILDNYLEMNNHRKTLERYTILRAIYSTSGHFTLEELNERLLRDMNFHVSRATMYNTLNLFLELRLVIRHRFQGSTKYEACYDNNSHCHQICTMCGKVTEVKSQGVIDAINDMPTRRFHKDGFTLYVYGICSSCQAKQRRRSVKKTDTKKVQKSK